MIFQKKKKQNQNQSFPVRPDFFPRLHLFSVDLPLPGIARVIPQSGLCVGLRGVTAVHEWRGAIRATFGMMNRVLTKQEQTLFKDLRRQDIEI